jgi:DNA-3-methyladenine glycosylase I
MSAGTPHRCAWAQGDPLLRAYHDEEWGVPEYDSRALWEKVMLDSFQAGLSWLTILRERDAYASATPAGSPGAATGARWWQRPSA